MSNNAIEQVRPTSTFQNFRHYESSVGQAADKLARLSSQIVANRDKIATLERPFDHSRMIVLWGGPGRGKTHLIEALINDIRDRAPKVAQRIYLSRNDFTGENLAFASKYDHQPIVVIDDMFSDLQSVAELHPRTDIQSFISFVMMSYEERRLVVATSNFPFSKGILRRVDEVDGTGRVRSRLREMMPVMAEIQLGGKDYRKVVARRTSNRVDPFVL